MPKLDLIAEKLFPAARKQAKAETGLSLEIFPLQCPYSLPELLSDDFLPLAVSDSIEDMD